MKVADHLDPGDGEWEGRRGGRERGKEGEGGKEGREREGGEERNINDTLMIH